MLKKLFYASASVLMLAIAYHLGAVSASAQAPGNPVVAMNTRDANGVILNAITANGDLYEQYGRGSAWALVNNVFAGGPTPAAQQTFGQVKAQYRK